MEKVHTKKINIHTTKPNPHQYNQERKRDRIRLEEIKSNQANHTLFPFIRKLYLPFQALLFPLSIPNRP